MDTVETEPHLETLTKNFAEHLQVPGASATAEVVVLMDHGSGITEMSEELVDAMRRHPRA